MRAGRTRQLPVNVPLCNTNVSQTGWTQLQAIDVFVRSFRVRSYQGRPGKRSPPSDGQGTALAPRCQAAKYGGIARVTYVALQCSCVPCKDVHPRLQYQSEKGGLSNGQKFSPIIVETAQSLLRVECHGLGGSLLPSHSNNRTAYPTRRYTTLVSNVTKDTATIGHEYKRRAPFGHTGWC
jgi:hypothetical protein